MNNNNFVLDRRDDSSNLVDGNLMLIIILFFKMWCFTKLASNFHMEDIHFGGADIKTIVFYNLQETKLITPARQEV